MPMLHAFWNIDHIARLEWNGRLAPLLIPSLTRHTDKHLACAMMYMPMVAASRLKGHVAHRQSRLLAFANIFGSQQGEMAIAREVFGVCRIGTSYGKRQMVGFVRDLLGHLIRPHILGKTEGSPCLGPSGIEGDVGYYLSYLGAGNAIVLGRLKMIFQRTIGNALTDE